MVSKIPTNEKVCSSNSLKKMLVITKIEIIKNMVTKIVDDSLIRLMEYLGMITSFQ